VEPFVGSFVLVALSEMGDKTQLLAFSLATRYRRPWEVMAGILVATLASSALASTAGTWISALVPPRVMSAVLAATFLGFGLWALRPDDDGETEASARFGPFLTTALLFLLAEMADKTQLATVALAARYHALAAVTAGATLALVATNGVAVLVGDRLAHRIDLRWLRRAAAALFFLFGGISAWTALRGG
jgi:putative Ca2+/H+ antiporter (TMEM165/GDT1 family)